MAESSSAFRRSLPVTLTSFINKAGTIGLSIVPVILVERHVGVDASAAVMGSIKVAGLVGILWGGRLCDRVGLRTTLILSFLVSGLGMLPLPFVSGALLLALCGALSQLGTSFYYASARLLVTQLVRPEERAEAIAWQRTGNNVAQVISYSLGALLGRFGTAFLLLFDSATSFVAAGVGAKLLPVTGTKEAATEPGRGRKRAGERREFYQGALIIAAFTFLYEAYSVAAAAECKLLFGTDGLATFSRIMVINTVLCGALSIVAARRIRRAEVAMPLGMAFLALGCAATFGAPGTRAWFYLGGFLVTMGEIVFNALAGMVLIVITPPGGRHGSLYSRGLLLQYVGRILGASAAFPLIVDGAHPLRVTAAAGVAGLVLCLASGPVLARAN